MIEVAKTAGFCFGVKRAVDEVYRMVENGHNVATLGELIHNPQVVDDLKSRGAFSYEKITDIPKGVKVVIRTHGVGKAVVDELLDRGYEVEDLTCPFVKKIHNIVEEHHNLGYDIIIVGDANHPEVCGINGWCENSAQIVYEDNYKDLEIKPNSKVCVVAQTTINREIFGQIVNFVKKACKTPQIFDTICNATKCRQDQARELASRSDLMIVVGGAKSSNTRKLFEISSSVCAKTLYVEAPGDIGEEYSQYKRIGITAGASTPGRIIEEVVRVMEEMVKNEESFEEMLNNTEFKPINNGDIIEGTVVEVKNNEVIVDLGVYKYSGQLAADQLTDDPSQKPQDLVKPGDVIKVYVVGVNDSEGKVVLSRKKIVQQESWNKIMESYESGEVLEGKIIKAVKGGVIAYAKDSQVFIPARQASARFVQDLTTLIGTTVKFKLIEADEKRRRVVGSVRKIVEEEKKAAEEAFWADAEVGKRYSGVVKSITNFGVFVDIGGVDGLVHISELSWSKIGHPSELVSEGDVLEVYIKDINAETKKISLGYKKTEDNPWVIAESKLSVGDVVKCKIVRILPFGAFAEIIPSVDGLIHISQIADRRIEKPDDVLEIGQEVEAKITELNWEAKKISLSIRALIAPVEEAEVEADADAEVEVEAEDAE